MYWFFASCLTLALPIPSLSVNILWKTDEVAIQHGKTICAITGVSALSVFLDYA
jgi:hypothetical protein